jgi:hypothetical protein
MLATLILFIRGTKKIANANSTAGTRATQGEDTGFTMNFLGAHFTTLSHGPDREGGLQFQPHIISAMKRAGRAMENFDKSTSGKGYAMEGKGLYEIGTPDWPLP